MTPTDIDLIRRSLDAMKPIAPIAAALFYGRLFEIAPEVRPLFKGDMDEQGRKLMATLAAVVVGLHDIDTIIPVSQALARRHVSYGVNKEHYAAVGEALIWTLSVGLDGGWTDAHVDAWRRAYALLSDVMIRAAEETSLAA